ncbi:MAG TPA: phosphoglucomutase, partial [Ferruginibacter sp.]|nr:phosphoglucomutase [Ferruginibacter sp.]
MVIGHDSRNNSRSFAEITAHVFAANDIKVYLFESLRPTPEISFAIRELKCQGGVVC